LTPIAGATWRRAARAETLAFSPFWPIKSRIDRNPRLTAVSRSRAFFPTKLGHCGCSGRPGVRFVVELQARPRQG